MTSQTEQSLNEVRWRPLSLERQTCVLQIRKSRRVPLAALQKLLVVQRQPTKSKRNDAISGMNDAGVIVNEHFLAVQRHHQSKAARLGYRLTKSESDIE